MTDTNRLRAAKELQSKLQELMTDEEQNLYPVLDHLYDFIEDLKK